MYENYIFSKLKHELIFCEIDKSIWSKYPKKSFLKILEKIVNIAEKISYNLYGRYDTKEFTPQNILNAIYDFLPLPIFLNLLFDVSIMTNDNKQIETDNFWTYNV